MPKRREVDSEVSSSSEDDVETDVDTVIINDVNIFSVDPPDPEELRKFLDKVAAEDESLGT